MLKPRSACVTMLPYTGKACPFVSHAWMYRNPLKTIASFTSMGEAIRSAKTHSKSLIARLLELLVPPSNELFFPEPLDVFFGGLRPDNDVEAAAKIDAIIQAQREDENDGQLLWTRFLAMHLHFFNKCQINIPCLTYEDLVSNPEQTLKPILELCGMPLSSLSKCLEAMEVDSQV